MSDLTPSPPPENRRLAAVVFTDVVGYSARMQRDEATTISEAEADLERMRKLCVEYGGEVLNSMGDGLMLCFPSAVKGVSFALKVQGEFAATAARSAATADRLEVIAASLERENRSLSRVADLAEAGGRAMLADLGEWRLANQQRRLQLP